MAGQRLTPEILSEALTAYRKVGTYTEAARSLGIPPSTFQNRVTRALQMEEDGIPIITSAEQKTHELPVFPDDDIPVEEILDSMEKRFERRAQASAARKWYTCKINTTMPIGLCFIGDVHIDDNGCNIPLLRRDCKLMAERDEEGNPLFFCTNLGDSSNGDWPGRLMKLHAQQDQSITTARRLVDWFINDTGLTWAAILIGNHDAWGDGAEILSRMNIQKVPMLDWTARFKLRFQNDRECKIIASHSFPGRSWINPLHSNQRREMVEEASIFASGHTHDWGIHHSENPYRNECFWLVRARGYKYLDQHAERLGYSPQNNAATVCAVIDPTAEEEVNFIQCFADMKMASNFLKYKRANVRRSTSNTR